MTLLTAPSAMLVASALGRSGWSGKGTPYPGEQLAIPFQSSLEPGGHSLGQSCCLPKHHLNSRSGEHAHVHECVYRRDTL